MKEVPEIAVLLATAMSAPHNSKPLAVALEKQLFLVPYPTEGLVFVTVWANPTVLYVLGGPLKVSASGPVKL
jgi:hypothetical protein